MIELVPNNTKRIDLSVWSPNANAQATAVSGITIIVRVAASPTATAAIGSMNYTATAYASLLTSAPHYYADILGADVDSAISGGQAQYDTQYAIQVIEGTVVTAYLDAIIRRTRRL